MQNGIQVEQKVLYIFLNTKYVLHTEIIGCNIFLMLVEVCQR